MNLWNLLLHYAALVFVLLVWLDASRGVCATAITTTIDDTDSRIQYSDDWHVGGQCNRCAAVIPFEERKNAHQATWRDATNMGGDVHFKVTFTGSACYVYGILRNGNQTKIGYTAKTNLTLIMDDQAIDYFQHNPSGDDQWLFNRLVYSKEGMNEGLHNLTVRVEPKSLFLFDYLKITSEQPDPLIPAAGTNSNIVKIASIVGVICALVLIGLVMLWIFHRRRKRGVRVIKPHNSLLLDDYPRASGSPPARITPFHWAPQYSKTAHDGAHEGIILLTGAPVTGDRKNKPLSSEVPAYSDSIHDLREPQVASTSAANVPSREPLPPPISATYAPSVYGGIRESVYGGVTSDYADAQSERSAPPPHTATVTPPRPLPLTSSSSSTPPPVRPLPQQPLLFPPAVTATEITQMRMPPQTLPPQSPVSPPHMIARTMVPPHRSPTRTSPSNPLPDSHTPQ